MEALDAKREKRFLKTIKAFRTKCFDLDKPFLMLSADLPEGESYWEFKDGRIEIQRVLVVQGEVHSIVVRVLDEKESEKVRESHGIC